MEKTYLPPESNKRFQVLSLSGGGFRGLYTAKIIADIESEIGGPIASRFDLIAGTSIGGVLAIALAMEIPAEKMVNLFTKYGEEIFQSRISLFNIFRSSYSAEPLKRLLSAPDLFGDKLLGDCKHPVIVPAINYSSGMPVVFKTAHEITLKRDWKHRALDVALATSAAPSYFPRHVFDNNQYVDGGLFANSPSTLALHEAQQFFGQSLDSIYVMSIGTMSSRYTVDVRQNRKGGAIDWAGWKFLNMPKRLFSLAISVQESLSENMLNHQLGMRYWHIDEILTNDSAKAVSLDRADKHAQEVLLGAAREQSKRVIGDARRHDFLSHQARAPLFFSGPHHNQFNTVNPV